MNCLPLSLISFPSSLSVNQRDVRYYQHLRHFLFFFFLEVIQKYIGDFERAEEEKGKKRLINLPLSCGHASILTPFLALQRDVTPTPCVPYTQHCPALLFKAKTSPQVPKREDAGLRVMVCTKVWQLHPT